MAERPTSPTKKMKTKLRKQMQADTSWATSYDEPASSMYVGNPSDLLTSSMDFTTLTGSAAHILGSPSSSSKPSDDSGVSVYHKDIRKIAPKEKEEKFHISFEVPQAGISGMSNYLEQQECPATLVGDPLVATAEPDAQITDVLDYGLNPTLVEPQQQERPSQPSPLSILSQLVHQVIPHIEGKGHGLDISSFLTRQPDEDSSIPADSQEHSATLADGQDSPRPADFGTLPEISSDEDYSSLPLFNSPLCTVTVHDCMVSLLAFAQSAHLSGASTSELLGLLQILLPQPNNLPKTAHMFKKYFQNDSNEIQLFFFCSHCWRTVSPHAICTQCSAPKRKVNYFVFCSLEKQLKRLYSRPGFYDKLKYRFSRKKQSEENIEDIYDGTVYKDAEKGLLSNPQNISLTWYSDGISIYECSTYSLWICMYVINELPPEDRHKIENVLIGGLWGGNGKPHPNTFLAPMYPDILKLKEGIRVKPHGFNVEIDVCAILLCGTCDVPAKACFMNMKAHSGYYSCPKCLIKGEKSDRTGNVMVFPHQDVLELRTDENYWESVQQGINCKDGHMGVFGPTILYYMFHGSFIAGMTCDVMHAAYMGCTKQLLRLWFDVKFKGKPFSLIDKAKKINERLEGLNLPHFVQRTLLEVDTSLCFWKASLCRTFLLYIVIILMKGIMPDKYYENLCMLVEGIALLNGSSISPGDMDKADQLLTQFCKDFQNLYGCRHMSSNFHLLRHLKQCVVECGPLQINSCFRLEDLNGLLAALVHGTRHAILQIISRLSLVTDLPLLIKTVNNQSAKEYCNKLIRRTKNFKLGAVISKGVYVVGDFCDFSQENESIKARIENLYEVPPLLQYFYRLYKNYQLYVSTEYDQGSRISYMCRYQWENELRYGRILTFVACAGKYLAYIEKSTLQPAVHRYTEILPSPDRDLIPISELICVSFCLVIENHQYVIDPLNYFELE